jgi:hypothetical protein
MQKKYLDLSSSDEQIKELIHLQTQLKYKTLKNQQKYSYIISKYNKVLKELRIFITDMVGFNKFSKLSALSEIVFDGYLSYNKNFQIYCGEQSVLDLHGYFGIDILDGKGCCRHISSLGLDTFKNDYILIPCHVNTEKQVEICEKADHICLLFSYYNRYYIFDLLNDNLYQIENLTAKSLVNQYTMQLYFEDTIFVNLYSYRKMNKLIKKVDMSKVKTDDIDVVIKCSESSEIILNNPSQCEDFYNNIKSNLQEVHEQKKLIIKRFR